MSKLCSEIIANRPVISGTPDMKVRAAAKAMTEAHVSAIAVVDAKDATRIVGIFTERDAVMKVLAVGLNPDTTLLSDVMRRDPQTIRAALPLAYALHLMTEGGFRHVPVVDDDGKLVGMVSARDALGEDLARLGREMLRKEELENPRS